MYWTWAEKKIFWDHDMACDLLKFWDKSPKNPYTCFPPHCLFVRYCTWDRECIHNRLKRFLSGRQGLSCTVINRVSDQSSSSSFLSFFPNQEIFLCEQKQGGNSQQSCSQTVIIKRERKSLLMTWQKWCFLIWEAHFCFFLSRFFLLSWGKKITFLHTYVKLIFYSETQQPFLK